MSYPVNITFPFDHVDQPEDYLTMDAVREIARAAEDAGFAAGCVTDHPVPSSRWLDAGGHYAQDPFVMLSLIAAATTRLRLQTNILVLPYRNPFVTARSVATLDVFSGGRVVLGMGAGYLKAEYKALGVDFDARNALMDEYIAAMKLAWTGEDFAFEGTGYTALGNRVRPTPIQRPHPPLLIGGNSRMAIRRAVEHGDAWNPFFAPSGVLTSSRTASIAEEAELDAALAYMRDHSAAVGRTSPPGLFLSSIEIVAPGYDPQFVLDRIALYRAKGADGVGLGATVRDRAEWCDLVRDLGERVLAQVDD